MRLQDFLKTEFRRLSENCTKDIIYSVQRYFEDIKTGKRLSMYECYHYEADTILFFICNVLKENGFNDPIIFNAEDTDVVVLSTVVSNEIDGTLAIRKKKATYYCKQLCEPDVAVLIAKIHVLTGADATSGFF